MATHDPSYKLRFSHRDLVADLIRGFVHEDWVAKLDFSTLQRVSEISASHEVTDLQEMHAMLAERVKTWTEEWKQRGLEEGLEQGISQGEAKLLRGQLVRRFGALPAWAEARLAQASEVELELWADRVLECATLEEVINGSA